MSTLRPPIVRTTGGPEPAARQRGAPGAQHGVVLIMALIMLVVISLLATLSIRNAISTEGVSGAVRTGQLASQAAEVALMYCENAVTTNVVAGLVTNTNTVFVTGTEGISIQPYNSTPQWQSTTLWDSTPTAAFVLPAATVNQAGMTATYSRPPECMVERQPLFTNAGTVSYTASYIITARGFGPEVAAADAGRSRPVGSEVWVQSNVEY